MEFITDLFISNFKWFYWRLAIYPLGIVALLYIIYIIALKTIRANKVYDVDKHTSLLFSVVITTIIYNILWFYIILKNGIYIFNWSQFGYNRTNIYLMLSPLIVGYILLLTVFLIVQSKIKNNIK